jgi:hypothetical protein
MEVVVGSRLTKAKRELSLLFWPITFGLLARFSDLTRGAKDKAVYKSLLFNFF